MSFLRLFAAIPLTLILPAIRFPPSQTMINLVKYESFGQHESQIPCKCFKTNDLQSKQLAGGSNPVKANQTCLMSLSMQRFLILNS